MHGRQVAPQARSEAALTRVVEVVLGLVAAHLRRRWGDEERVCLAGGPYARCDPTAWHYAGALSWHLHRLELLLQAL